MRCLEEYYGLCRKKRVPLSKLLNRTAEHRAKEKLNSILKEVNTLYVGGFYSQTFSLLKEAVQLVPSDSRPFYLLGLIHEEIGNSQKALYGYMIAALLKGNNTLVWKKIHNISKLLGDNKSQSMAIERISRKEPSEELLREKLSCFKRLNKKYWIICCEIELFRYDGINEQIFEKLERVRYKNVLARIAKRLVEFIRSNSSACSLQFIENTIKILYKVKRWAYLIDLFNNYYQINIMNYSTELFLIYIMANLGINEKQQISQIEELIFENLLNMDLDQHVDKLCELTDMLVSCKMYKTAIKIMNKVMEIDDKIELKVKLADVYEQAGDLVGAVQNYQEVLNRDPTDVQARVKMYELYKQLGEPVRAIDYKNAVKIKQFNDLDIGIDKSEYRYSEEQCIEMRRVYELAMESLNNNNIDYFLELGSGMVDDFFSNGFVNLRTKNFKAFKAKGEKIDECSSLMLVDEHESRKNRIDRIIRISSLHGLDTYEWLAFIITFSHCLIASSRAGEALTILKKTVDIHIFNTPRNILELCILGIKASFVVGEFNEIIDFIRRIATSYDYTSTYLLYYFCNFVPEFFNKRKFQDYQRGIQRLYKKKVKYCEIYDGNQEYSNSEEDALFVNEGNENMLLKFTGAELTAFLGGNSFLPRHLFTPTVNFLVDSLEGLETPTKIVAGAVCITHTRSRAVYDKGKYAKQGMEILNSIEEEGPLKWYNMAKGYHFFGYLSQAEQLYEKVVGSGKGELRRMAIYNLQLIYRNNKSKAFISSWYKEVFYN